MGSNPVWRDLPDQTCREAHPASCRLGTGFFPGVKRWAYGAYCALPSSAEVANGLQPYFRHPPPPALRHLHWHVVRRHLILLVVLPNFYGRRQATGSSVLWLIVIVYKYPSCIFKASVELKFKALYRLTASAHRN